MRTSVLNFLEQIYPMTKFYIVMELFKCQLQVGLKASRMLHDMCNNCVHSFLSGTIDSIDYVTGIGILRVPSMLYKMASIRAHK